METYEPQKAKNRFPTDITDYLKDFIAVTEKSSCFI